MKVRIAGLWNEQFGTYEEFEDGRNDWEWGKKYEIIYIMFIQPPLLSQIKFWLENKPA